MSVFEITIQREDEGDWPAVVRHQPGAQALAQWSRGRLDLDLARLEALRPTDKEYGTLLGQALFREEIRDAFVRACTGTSGRDEPLRVLLIVEAEDLRDLHWEQLCAPLDRGWDYLLLNQATPFSLYLPSQIERRFPPIGRRDLRALILVAGPEELEDEEWGLAPFDVAATVRTIQDALGEIPADVLASVEGAAGRPTLNNLCEQLTAGAPSGSYSLLHIVCHGAYHQATGETLLYFPQDEGLGPVPATELIERLGRLRRLPHLTFLSTCESADPKAESGLGGLGQRLVRDLGMPAVVAMTDRISVDTAGALASAFYARLRECGEVDCALSEALVGLQGRDDVTVPALFSRLGGRALFSDALDRPLTEAEIGYGLAQMRALIEQRAPVLLDEAERLAATVESTLGTDLTALSAEARRERQAALAAANQLCSQALDLSFNALALGQPPPAYDGRCPFPGLMAFGARYVASGQKEQDDREFFFGRKALVDKLSGRLMEHRFLAVLGPSGCGKSSLVLAGLVPALQARLPRLRVAYLTPGSEPLAQLEAALSGASGGDGKPNLIIVDQFEELFTLCRHESERQGFVDRLLALSAGTALVLTLRADFWGECAAYGALKEEMQAHQELVAPMDAAALRRAMERQADHVGLRFEAGLGEAILDDVEGEPGAMPLLQHALLLLWQRRHGRWLRWEEYRAIGGIRQAIAHTADEVYLGLAGQEQARMRDVFLRLTRLEDAPAGAEARDTRRRVGMTELVPAGSDPAETVALVKRLADARLVVTSLNAASGQEEVEVAHEALIRHWPRLRGWLEEDRAELHLREGVREAALEWEANERDEAYLVHRGGRLEDAESLQRQPRFALNELEQAYVEACVGLRERERQERAERRRKELEAARKLAAEQQARAEEHAASAGRMRRRAVAIGAVGIVALVLAGLSMVLWLRAQDSAAEANSQKGIAQANAATAEANLGMANVRGTEAAAALVTAESEAQARTTQEARAVANAGLAATSAAQAVAAKGTAESEAQARATQEAEAVAAKGTAEAEAQARATQEAEAVAAQQTAQANAEIAHARELAALASGQVEEDLDLALLLGVEAFQREDLLQTRQALFLGWSHTPELSRFLHGPASRVRSVAWSADGRLASGYSDGTVVVWDVDTGQPAKILEGHQSGVNSVAWSADGRLAFGSDDGTVIIWDPDTGQQDQPLREHSDRAMSVAWSVDGRLAAGTEDGTVIVWDLGTGQAALPLEGHQSAVSSVAWSVDGRLASGSCGRREGPYCRQGEIIVWDLQSPLPSQFPLKGHSDRVMSVAWSADGRLLASGANDGTVIVWNLDTGQPALPPLEGHPDPNQVTSLAWSADGRLASGATDNTVIVWNLDTGEPAQTLEGHLELVTSVAWSADGRLASGSWDHNVIVWDPAKAGLERGGSAQILEGHRGGNTSVAWSADGRLAAGSWSDTDVIVWDLSKAGLERGERPLALKGHTEYVRSVAWSADGRLASGSDDGTVIVWDLESGQPLLRLVGHQSGVNSVAWSADGRLASGSDDETVIVWNLESGQPLLRLVGHQSGVNSVAWSADEQLASGSVDVIVWDLESGQQLQNLGGHAGHVNSVAWSADGRLASGSGDGTVIVWDLERGLPVQTLTEHSRPVLSVAWSADGRLASGSGDGTVIVWDLERGLPVHTLAGSGQVNSVAWSADGRLASGSETLQVWNMDPEEWIRQACDRAGRNLTRAEWALYFPGEDYHPTCDQWPEGR